MKQIKHQIRDKIFFQVHGFAWRKVKSGIWMDIADKITDLDWDELEYENWDPIHNQSWNHINSELKSL